MPSLFLNFNHITFSYDTSTEALFADISFNAATGWSGVIGANGTGKTTLMKLATGLLSPVEGNINVPAHAIYCDQRTDDVPNRLRDLLAATDRSAHVIKSQSGIEDDWCERWDTLSHGERKRAQIGVALWLEPDVLAIDEPTNHVDAAARENIFQALRSFKGIGLLVSHDRELLDLLCYQCIYIDPPEVIVRPGGYSQTIHAIEEERGAVKKQYLLKRSALKELKKEVQRRQTEATKSKKRVSKKGLAKKDSDARAKRDAARVSGKDAVAGRLKKQLSGRLSQMNDEFDQIKLKKDYTMGIWLPGSVSRRDYLVQLPANRLKMGEYKILHYPDLLIKPKDHIGITGPNGSGKSTLIRHLVHHINAPDDNITYIPQEIPLERSQQILHEALTLSHDKLGHLMTIVSRLGSLPQRLLESAEPSPGEFRKLLLALGMTKEPHIIIMDEPTNHLDLPSIECLEAALGDCPCCLVLVSHDMYFLDKLTTTRWDIARDEDSEEIYYLHMLV
ncbi:ABC-F family ATP-binding cassette domain-containing protein [candidate division KSB1 bacterium]|nr:ABC-F family ATP-binding cassette domain-containing protein [candidate division KSB1 bacterium]